MYALSKLLTEEAAFEFAKDNNIDLISVITTTVGGPFLTPTVPTSIRVLLSPVTGSFTIRQKILLEFDIGKSNFQLGFEILESVYRCMLPVVGHFLREVICGYYKIILFERISTLDLIISTNLYRTEKFYGSDLYCQLFCFSLETC